MFDVLRANEIVLSDGTTTTRFPVVGPLTPALISVFPGKVVLGDYTRDTEQIASSLVMEGFSGGLLLQVMDKDHSVDRAWTSSLDTRFRKFVVLLPLATATPYPKDDAGTGTETDLNARAHVTYGVPPSSLYVAFDDRIRQYDFTNDEWDIPTGYTPATHNLAATCEDATIVQFGATEWAVFADGAGYTQFNGTTWTRKTGNGTTVPNARFLATWDGKLWTLDDHNILWWTLDLTTWNKETDAYIPVPPTDLTGLLTFFDSSNHEALFATARNGAWVYDPNFTTWYRTRVRFPRSPRGGLGAVQYRDDLYIPAGMSVYRFNGSALQSVGLDRDDGVDSSYRGSIETLTDMFNWLVAGVNSDETTAAAEQTLFGGEGDPWQGTVISVGDSRASLWAWDGTGWHTLWTSGTAGSGLHWLGVTDAGSELRLWWGADNLVYWMAIPDGIFNPLELPDWQYATTGELVTPRYDMNWAEQDKTTLAFHLRGSNLGATRTITVYYGIDDADSWTPLGTLTADGIAEYLFGTDGIGAVVRNIRFRYVLQSDDPAESPILHFGALKFLRRLPPLYSYTFSIDCSQEYGGLSAYELQQQLETYIATETLLTLAARRDERELVQKKGFLAHFVGQAWAGPQEQGRFQVAFAET